MAALGYFKSPSTGNAVTWDSTGAQTDTGLTYDGYKLPVQQTQTSSGGGGPDPVTQPAIPAGPQRFDGDGGTHGIYQPSAGPSMSFEPWQGGAKTAPAAPAKQPMTAEQNAAILSAWNKSGSPQDFVPLMNKYNVSIPDVQNALSSQGGYSPTAVADYLGYHGYSADPTSGLLSKSSAPASSTPYAVPPAFGGPPAQPQTPSFGGGAPAGPYQQAAGALSQAAASIPAWQPQTQPGNVMQGGQTAGGQGTVSAQAMNWGANQSGAGFNTPGLDALYSAQKQRLGAQPGALTQAIAG